MAKKSGFTLDWLKDRGLSETSNGVYAKKNAVVGNVHEITIPKIPITKTIDFQAVPKTEWFIAGYNVPSKKNSRQNFVKNGKQISIPSKNHATYVKMTKMQYAVFGKEFAAAVEYYKLLYPLYVQFEFIRDSQRRFDFCNACQTCEDLMVENGWLPDDSADYIVPVFIPYHVDKQNPGVKIKLLLK